MIAGGTIAGTTTVGLVAAAPVQAAPALGAGVQTVCVSGTHGRYARLTLLDANRHRLAVFHVRKGCLTFRADKDLPSGIYRIKHRAPNGHLTGHVMRSGGFVNPDGSAGSAASRDRNPPHLRKVKSAEIELGPTFFGTLNFSSVKKRHH